MKLLTIEQSKFMYYDSDICVPCGEMIDIILREVIHPKKTQRDINYLQYLVELVSLSKCSVPIRLAVLRIDYPTADSKICMNVFRDGAFGQTHRLGLKEFTSSTDSGVVLTINGLLWDDGIIHVKDIAA